VKDQRLYGKFTLNFPHHPKILILSDTAFRCLVEATLWSREQQTDGFLARRLALAKWSLDALHECATNDAEKPSLIERDEGWYIHDFAEHQDTKADIEARRERNRIAGQKGGIAKGKRSAKPKASAVTSVVPSEKLAEEEKAALSDLVPEPLLTSTTEPPTRCPKHVNWVGTVPNCHECGDARHENQAWKDGAFERRRLAREAKTAAALACPHCDDDGRVEIEDEWGNAAVKDCPVHNHQRAAGE
jgi:hypothetical protein